MAEPTETALTQWKQLRDPDVTTIAFVDGAEFLNAHPEWPDTKIIRLRTEAAALTEQPKGALIEAFCEDMPPISGRGMFACLKAQAGTNKQRDYWLHQGWLQGDFSASEEQQILHDHTDALQLADHRNRLERLLYEHKTTAAKRLLDAFPAIRRPHHTVWIAMIEHDRRANAKLRALPKSERHKFGILFEQLSAVIDARKFNTAVKLAREVPGNAPYPALWWPLRHTAIREALADRHYDTALDILNRTGTLEGTDLAEALWLKGWITLSFKHQPKAAYKAFHQLYTEVSTPVSRARAAYWAGRAAHENGNDSIAQEWYQKAALHPTVFYGQLAHVALAPKRALPLPDAPAPSANERRAFEHESVVKAARLLAKDEDPKLRDRFLNHLASSADSTERLALVSMLAQDIGGLSSGVKSAKMALRQQIVLLKAGWPRIALPSKLGVESALALAISRQESEFDPNARSSADARGLMQLLPTTARHVAKQHGITYRKSSLTNPAQNLTLGTAYLGQIIDGFDGSYVLGIASYNAGPTNVRRWINSMGNPPKTLNGMLDWIEAIPYGETRNYVMRVLENLTVYRTLATPDHAPEIIHDLTR